jgi:hypothetical protein
LLSVVLAAGLLALIQVESPIEVVRGTQNTTRFVQHNTWRQLYRSTVNKVGGGGVTPSLPPSSKLRQIMEDDELAGQNPFEGLKSDGGFQHLFDKEISAFERQTLRSPSYREEAGYDLVHYEILYADGTMARLLAYVAETNEPIVMVLTPNNEHNEYSLYRNGSLEEMTLVMPEEGDSLLAQRLESGIPFLSVSR